MTQAAQTPHTVQPDEIDRRWFHWAGGVVKYFSNEAQLSLLNAGTDDAIEKFLFAYGLIRSHGGRSGDAEWFVRQMPSDGPAVYFCDEHVEETEQFVAQLKGEEHPTYNPEQLREVAACCLAQAKAYIDLAPDITSGRFSFPEPPVPVAGDRT